MARPPIPITELLASHVERTIDALSVRLTGARSMLERAAEYLGSGDDNRAAERSYAALTNYHEAARLALTAMILLAGDRLRGATRAHQAVLDYALERRLITRPEWQVLDELRQTRNEIEYADDATAPSETDVRTVSHLALKLYDEASIRIVASATKAAAKKTGKKPSKAERNAGGKPIPPPPAPKR